MTRRSKPCVIAMLLAVAFTTRAIDYEYDALDRLVRVVRDDGSEERYAYDAAGNVTSVTTSGRSSTAVVAGLGAPGTLRPDRDVWTFQGSKGETVTVRLEAEPREAGIGRRISLVVRNKAPGTQLRRQDASALPNEIAVALPADGTYEIVVQRQQEVPQEARYAGGYRLTFEARPDTCATLTVETHR